MPTYEYTCTNEVCHHAWEAEQSIKEPALTECPICKQETAKRLIAGGTTFVLKGGGWYAQGYSKGA
jgi:putative FmdB family regulatory protein